jgi:hypothetical protein
MTIRVTCIGNNLVIRGGKNNLNRVISPNAVCIVLQSEEVYPADQDSEEVSTWFRAILEPNNNFQITEVFFHPRNRVDVVGINQVTMKEENFDYPDRADPSAKAYPWNSWGI